MPWQQLADAVLVLHFAVVLFVVGGLVAVLLGGAAGWQWVRAWPFRIAHALAIAFVVVQSWIGQVCPLTTLEIRLRERAGVASYEGSFVEHWVARAMFFDAPEWVFTAAYAAFGVSVAVAWVLVPPRRRPR